MRCMWRVGANQVGRGSVSTDRESQRRDDVHQSERRRVAARSSLEPPLTSLYPTQRRCAPPRRSAVTLPNLIAHDAEATGTRAKMTCTTREMTCTSTEMTCTSREDDLH